MITEINGLLVTLTLTQEEKDVISDSSINLLDAITNSITDKLNWYLDGKIRELTDKNPNKLTLEEKITLINSL